jgi:hypothetical protein
MTIFEGHFRPFMMVSRRSSTAAEAGSLCRVLIVRLKAARFHGAAWRRIASLWKDRGGAIFQQTVGPSFFARCGWNSSLRRLVAQAGAGSFDCAAGFAQESRCFAQDDSWGGLTLGVCERSRREVRFLPFGRNDRLCSWASSEQLTRAPFGCFASIRLENQNRVRLGCVESHPKP